MELVSSALTDRFLNTEPSGLKTENFKIMLPTFKFAAVTWTPVLVVELDAQSLQRKDFRVLGKGSWDMEKGIYWPN